MDGHDSVRRLPSAGVAVETVDGVARVTVGRGSRRNALQRHDWTDLADVFAHISEDPSVRCVVVRGRDGHFCSGSDLTSWAGASQATVHETFTDMESAFQAVERCRVPVVAVIEGTAAGAGCQLALACDLRVLHEQARLGMPTARLGILPSPAFAARLVALTGSGRARELLYTGRIVDAPEALSVGLAEHVAPGADLPSVVAELVNAISAAPPAVIAATKQTVAGLMDPALRSPEAPTVEHALMQAALRRYGRPSA